MKTASEEVTEMIFMWKWGSQSLCAAATLGLFDHLDPEEPRSADQVAEAAGLDAALLYRLLRALASLSLLNETSDRRFILTEHGGLLRSDARDSLRHMAILEGGAEHWALWRHLPAMIRDGRQNAFVREFGKMAFDYAREHPDGYGAIFGRAMSGFSAVHSQWALEALRDYDFSRISSWCDVAGGHGHTMCAFLNAHPHLTGTVFDLSEVIAEEDQLWAYKLGLSERCNHITGDMFREVPVKADAYSLKMILHDWNDEECVQILGNIRQSARPDSRIFIIEHVVPGPAEPHFAKLFDIMMMCWGSGRERTEAEYAELLESSGWRYTAAHYPQSMDIGVIEGVAV